MPEQERQPDADLRFTRLWIDAQHTLTGFVTLHVHNYAAVDDIIQEVASQATENFDQYDPARPFGAWLIGIARMRIAESYRKQGRSPVVFSDDIMASITQAFIAAQPESSDRLEALRDCMGKLSDRHRRVIDLRRAPNRSQNRSAAAPRPSTRCSTASAWPCASASPRIWRPSDEASDADPSRDAGLFKRQGHAGPRPSP